MTALTFPLPENGREARLVGTHSRLRPGSSSSRSL